jgi:hypothetical protein
MRPEQAKSEMAVFTAFSDAARLKVRPGTVQNRLPPEPDISCELEDLGHIGFELVEIVDSDLARMVSDQIRMQEVLRGKATHEKAVSDRFSDALVYVRFVGGAPVRQRERAIPRLFEFLTSLAPEFEGDSAIPRSSPLAGTVRSVRVSRGQFPPGPHFQVEAGSFIQDPIVERLRAKFAKQYGRENRVELLAFYHLHPCRPPEMWVRSVATYVQANITQSPFSRVWIFDFGGNEVLFRSDCASNGGVKQSFAVGD